jgi:CxxC motif-containing protein (DUF1111 family)
MSAKLKQGPGSKRKTPGKATLVTLAVLALPPFTMVVGAQQPAPRGAEGMASGQNPRGQQFSSPNSSSRATDPGPRGGSASAGGMITGLDANQQAFFTAGQTNFIELDSVTGSVPNTGNGLGPVFNAESCGACHAQPAIGGTSPASNPQIGAATDQGAQNSIPYFITSTGPVREARFQVVGPPFSQSVYVPDGGVHDVYTITGRSDAAGCSITQPNFTQAEDNDNISLRIPTPVFGAGLIENIPDATIIANMNANLSQKQSVGIYGGVTNNSGNDGGITKFGWKAQNRSLNVFSGEAYNVEMGVTNELFQTERNQTAGCLFNGTPEDSTNFDRLSPNTSVVSDVERFRNFMAFLAPPGTSTSNIKNCPGSPSTYNTCSASVSNGQTQFNNIGCVLCHTTSMSSGSASVSALSNQTANLFSDLLLHHMGPLLADNILQGQAQGDMYRTAPLWGLGQRLFFLHDGRETNLVNAIEDHGSNEGYSFTGPYFEYLYGNSEANGAINNYNALSAANQQDLLNFLRSL